MFLVSKRF